MSIRFALTSATTRSLNAVSSAASLIDRSLTSVDLLAEAGEAHARLYRDRTVASCSISADELQLQAEDDAKHRITMRRIAMNERMKDSEYASIFNSISFTNPQAALPAAE